MIRIKKGDWKKVATPNIPGLPQSEYMAWYAWGDTTVCVAKEEGLWHISISARNRYPDWDEIYSAWYDLVPDAAQITGAILLPRKVEYVNFHPNCFHVHQLRDTEILSAPGIKL